MIIIHGLVGGTIQCMETVNSFSQYREIQGYVEAVNPLSEKIAEFTAVIKVPSPGFFRISPHLSLDKTVYYQ